MMNNEFFDDSDSFIIISFEKIGFYTEGSRHEGISNNSIIK
jgi:hypothetical protein